MNKLFWWNLNSEEKAKRSFILAPVIGVLAFLFMFLANTTLSTLSILGISIAAVFLMVAQGLYYKRKADKET
ncbi:MAG: hypothetical protein ACTJH9_06605 [Pseudoalteromonas sp.]|uniref:hypothetical protein n=1 Tax=unclassified Pseudoalteromonas TaxID=194690 RepID=UPI003F9AABB7